MLLRDVIHSVAVITCIVCIYCALVGLCKLDEVLLFTALGSAFVVLGITVYELL